jgi:hypothetical protein
LFNEFIVIASCTIELKTLCETYIDFAQDYANKLFARTYENKITQRYSSMGKDTERLNTIVNKFLPKKTISSTLLSGVDHFLDDIKANPDQKAQIRELLLRRYRSKKEVRIADIQKIL